MQCYSYSNQIIWLADRHRLSFAPFINSLHVMTKFIRRAIILAGTFGVSLPGIAYAHPHVFADGHVKLDVDQHHQLVAVTNDWQFDAAFSAFAVTGLDKNGDGKLDAAELGPLAKTSMDSLKDYHFFTWASSHGAQASFSKPRDFSYRYKSGRLTLEFTLPLQKPLPLGKDLQVEVYDPEYFVAYTFPKHSAVEIKGAASGCKPVYTPPKPLDDEIMAKLASIPVDQHDLPPALKDAAVGLAYLFSVDCP